MTDALDELILDHTLLRVLEHFRVARVDYARNVTRYTEIQREIVQLCLSRLQEYGFIEKYMNTSIKKTEAKLKKSQEVHKHHTYYKISRSGVSALNSIDASTYLRFLETDCLSFLKKSATCMQGEERCDKLVSMGLLDRHFRITSLGKSVLLAYSRSS